MNNSSNNKNNQAIICDTIQRDNIMSLAKTALKNRTVQCKQYQPQQSLQSFKVDYP